MRTIESEEVFEARLREDEARLALDEIRLLEDEERMRSNRSVTRGLAVALVIAVASLVVAIVALRQDVHALSTAAPNGSVGTAAIQDRAVTANKLADGSVTAGALGQGSVGGRAIASGAVGGAQLGSGAVTGANVMRDSLTGASIRESTLGRVPAARSALDSRALGGLSAASYVSGLRTVHARSAMSAQGVKGPLSAVCPAGARIVSGGALIEGATHGIAIGTSSPLHGDEWVAVARRYRPSRGAWRLVVTAICAARG